MNARWQGREDERKRVRSAPNDRGLRRALKATTKQLKRTLTEAVRRFFEDYVSQLEGRIREGGQFGSYKHLKGMDVEGKRTFNPQYIKDEEGRLLRENALIRERWVRRFHKLLNTKSPTLDPNIVDELEQWPPCRPLDDVPSRYEVEEAILALANRKAVAPDGFGRRRRIEHSWKVLRYHRRCVEGRWRAATMEICNDLGASQEERSD